MHISRGASVAFNKVETFPVAGDENVDAAFSSVVDTGAGGAGVTTASPTVSLEPVATSCFMTLFLRFTVAGGSGIEVSIPLLATGDTAEPLGLAKTGHSSPFSR